MNNRLRKVPLQTLKGILLIYIVLIVLIVDWRIICLGLDASYYFAINYFANHHIIFGRDVIWTYGPLGFLTRPMDIGHNLAAGFLFQVSLWIIFAGLIVYGTLKGLFSVPRLCLFIFFFSISKAIGISIDYFICFLFFLLLSFSLEEERWRFFYAIALFLAALLWFIKFDAAFLASSAVFSFILVKAFIDRKKALNAAVLAVFFVPLLFLVSYLLYNPSLSGLLLYVRGIYEFSCGYSVASVSGSRIDFDILLFFIGTYVSFLYLLFKSRQTSFLILLFSILPLFIVFKRGFIRQDTHIFTFFSFSFYILALTFLFTDVRKLKDRIAIPVLSSLAVFFFLYNAVYPTYLIRSTPYNLSGAFMTLGDPHLRERAKIWSQGCLRDSRLPQDFLNKVGTHSIGIFPWEASFAAANRLNYRPFPVFQTYAAYTSYLDRLNARYLEDQNTAPEFILMEWLAIDNRHPLIDVPAMWLSMYKWYGVESSNSRLLLLKRKKIPVFEIFELVERREDKSNDYIDIPVSNNPIIVKMHMKLNFIGRLANIFFRLPEVKMELLMESGSRLDARIIPDTLQDGLLVNFLPMELKEVKMLIQESKINHVTDKIRIHGEGVKYYQNKIIVEFYKIP